MIIVGRNHLLDLPNNFQVVSEPPLRGCFTCLHESGLSFNPDRTHSVSIEIIGD